MQVVFAGPAPDNERPESTADSMSVPADPDPSVAQDLQPTPPATRRRAESIVATYAVVATLWIYLSDWALELLFPDPALLIRWSVYKGLGFVAVTSMLLLGMMRHAFCCDRSKLCRPRNERPAAARQRGAAVRHSGYRPETGCRTRTRAGTGAPGETVLRFDDRKHAGGSVFL